MLSRKRANRRALRPSVDALEGRQLLSTVGIQDGNFASPAVPSFVDLLQHPTGTPWTYANQGVSGLVHTNGVYGKVIANPPAEANVAVISNSSIIQTFTAPSTGVFAVEYDAAVGNLATPAGQQLQVTLAGATETDTVPLGSYGDITSHGVSLNAGQQVTMTFSQNASNWTYLGDVRLVPGVLPTPIVSNPVAPVYVSPQIPLQGTWTQSGPTASGYGGLTGVGLTTGTTATTNFTVAKTGHYDLSMNIIGQGSILVQFGSHGTTENLSVIKSSATNYWGRNDYQAYEASKNLFLEQGTTYTLILTGQTGTQNALVSGIGIQQTTDYAPNVPIVNDGGYGSQPIQTIGGVDAYWTLSGNVSRPHAEQLNITGGSASLDFVATSSGNYAVQLTALQTSQITRQAVLVRITGQSGSTDLSIIDPYYNYSQNNFQNYVTSRGFSFVAGQTYTLSLIAQNNSGQSSLYTGSSIGLVSMS